MSESISKRCVPQQVCCGLAIVLVLASSQVSQASESACAGFELDVPKEKFHVYLLIGQSNMAGRGKMSLGDDLPIRDVFMLDRENRWTPAAHPLHFDKPRIAGVGLGADFAKQMLKADPSIKIGLVPCAVGGTSLKQWKKGGELYAAAIERTKIAEECGELKGILWHQGEGDCGAKSASSYAQRLIRLISDLRNDLEDASLPFVLGELGEFRVGVKGRSDIVIQQQQSVPRLVAYAACVSSLGLNHKGDFAHFNAGALREFGLRYAQAMKSLQRRSDGEPLADKKDIVPGMLDGSMYHEGWIDLNKNGYRDAYEDSTLPVESRVEDLLSQMSTNEKTCQLVTLYGYQRVLKDDLPTPGWGDKIWKGGLANIDEHLNGIPEWRGKSKNPNVWPPSRHVLAINEVQRWFIEETRLGIPVDFTNEGIRGVCHQGATNFPAQVGIGATWNKKLVNKIGEVTGSEAAALGYTNIYSPILDLSRDPRWGRVVECYGEDPYLVSTLGVQQALGLQASGVASTAKHFAVYSVPKGGRDGQARTDPHVAPREMEETYLAPFEAVVRKAKIQGIMSSYNDYDGVPVSGSKRMLIDLLRDRFGFRGYVVSDSDAVKYLHSKHRVTSSIKGAVGLFLKSGGNVRTEFNAPERFVFPLRELIEDDKISMEVIDDRVRDVLRVKFEMGIFDSPYIINPKQSDLLVRQKSHRDVSLQAARESIVLLKNEKQLLPLPKDVGSILVCGPNAKAIGHSISRYGPTGGEVISLLDGVRAAVSQDTVVTYAPGATIVDGRWPESEIFYEPPKGNDAQMIAKAMEMAEAADVVIVALGESEETIGESKSRTDLSLTGYQQELVKSLQATGKPVVVVLINGRALTINWIDRHIPAIVEAWFPGEACGKAIADVLFGDYNPGGKLPITFPKTVGQLPFNFPFKPASQAGQGKGHNPNGVGSSRILGELYPFGYGLSYTTFAYDDLEINPDTIKPGETLSISLRLTNTGEVAGDEVVQLYLRDDVSSVVTYDSVLRGFERVHLAPGESKQVTFQLGPEEMQILNQKMERVVEPGDFTVMLGGSSKDERLRGGFSVTADVE